MTWPEVVSETTSISIFRYNQQWQSSCAFAIFLFCFFLSHKFATWIEPQLLMLLKSDTTWLEFLVLLTVPLKCSSFIKYWMLSYYTLPMAYRHGCLLIAGLTEEQKLYKLIKGADKWNMETALKRYCNPWGFYHKNVHRVLNSVNSRDGYITGLGAILHRVLKCGFLENDQFLSFLSFL